MRLSTYKVLGLVVASVILPSLQREAKAGWLFRGACCCRPAVICCVPEPCAPACERKPATAKAEAAARPDFEIIDTKDLGVLYIDRIYGHVFRWNNTLKKWDDMEDLPKIRP